MRGMGEGKLTLISVKMPLKLQIRSISPTAETVFREVVEHLRGYHSVGRFFGLSGEEVPLTDPSAGAKAY